MLMESLNDTTWIIIVIGSLIGSIKANFSNKDEQSKAGRAVNIILGVFCGIALAKHYSNDLTVWFSGLLALTGAMLSVTVLETIYLIAPTITRLIIKAYTNLHLNKPK